VISGAERRAARLLRWYPPAWRARYGDEFTELLLAEFAERPRSWRRAGDVARGGLLARLTGAGLSLIVITIAGALCAGTWVRLDTERMRSYAMLSRAVAERAPGAKLICYHRYVQALPFYTGKRVIVVGPLSELRFGADRAKDASEYFFSSDAELLRLWYAPNETVIVLEANDLARLLRRLGPFTMIATEHTKRAVVNHGETLVRR